MVAAANGVQKTRTEGPIVFYDGECGLCDRFVQWLIRADHERKIRYSTLQGETAKNMLGTSEGDPANWSVRLVDAKGTHDRSSAALRSMAHAGGVWRAALAFLIVPPFIRDGVYRLVATNRYRIFGKVEACMLPSPALRERFLP